MPALDAGIFFVEAEEDDRIKSGHDEQWYDLRSVIQTEKGIHPSNFMISVGVKVFHCGTNSSFEMRRGRKKLSSMTAIHSSHSDESATFGILLTNIFSALGRAKAERDRNFRMQSRKISIPSAHGAAAILPDLLKYSTESNYLSVYGRSVLCLARLPVVREVRAIH